MVAGHCSQTLLLVKNLAAKVTAAELTALFSKHGQVAQVLLPPANTLALWAQLAVLPALLLAALPRLDEAFA